jgi:hypothetical protein
VVGVGGSDGRVRRVVVVRLRRVGASVSARAPSARAGPGVLAGRGGGRGGVVGSTEWPIRAASPRANGPRHDASPFDEPRYDKNADGVPDRLSICLAHGVPCGFALSYGLTGALEGDGRCCSIIHPPSERLCSPKSASSILHRTSPQSRERAVWTPSQSPEAPLDWACCTDMQRAD